MAENNTIYFCDRCRQSINGNIYNLKKDELMYAQLCEKCLKIVKAQNPKIFLN